jgi:hypothetical protein
MMTHLLCLMIWGNLVRKVVVFLILYAKLLEEEKRELHEGCNTYTRLVSLLGCYM